jgi:serine phosphatase RsbU (regulator of sigma subunit)
VPLLAIDAVYVPAAEERLVGGDWYDALDMGNKGIFLVIGDVAGHGVEAAVTMSRARDEVFAAAVVEPDPAAVLVRVNEVLMTLNAGMITAVVGVIDENAREFRYAIAGHPPPLLVKPGGSPARLECGELPLGVTAGVAYQARSVKLQSGSALVLYTDGAIEQSHDIIAGERTLSDAIASTIERPDAAREIYRAIFTGASPRDDVAILTVRVTGDAAQTNEPAGLLTHAVSR